VRGRRGFSASFLDFVLFAIKITLFVLYSDYSDNNCFAGIKIPHLPDL